MNAKNIIKRDVDRELDKLEAVIDKKSHKLKAHVTRNLNTSHENHKIYHLLGDPFTFVNAYTKISKNTGALTKGIESDEEIMKFFGIINAENIAQKFRKNSYTFKPTRRVWIPKPGKNTKRPIDTPTQEDRIVQEALRGILEAIYEPVFKEFEKENNMTCTNYGFRPDKSTLDACQALKTKGQRSTYVIEGDIKGAYPSVNHDILIKILEIRIKDNKFIKLIRQLLESGVMDEGKYEHSLIGTPQGGIVSPLLFNIYMFEFDKFIYQSVIPTIKTQSKPKRCPKYQKLGYQMRILRSKIKEAKDEDKTKLKQELSELQKTRLKIPSYVINTLPKDCIYVRYADDWVLMFTGNFDTAKEIKQTLSSYLNSHLKLELDKNKTFITKIVDGFDFLGFTIKMDQGKNAKLMRVYQPKLQKRSLTRTTSRKITIYPSKTRVLDKLVSGKFCQLPNLEPIGIRSWGMFDEYDIVLKYRQIMVGLFDYYSDCDSTYLLNRVEYILRYSCAKTIATRKKITMSQVFQKYGNKLTIKRKITTKKGLKTYVVTFPLLKELKQQKLSNKNKNDSKIKHNDPFRIKQYWRTKYKLYEVCCICGSDDRVALHHLNSLRKTKTKDKINKIRSQLNRKQIPVCFKCHMEITHGRYSKKSPAEYFDKFIAYL